MSQQPAAYINLEIYEDSVNLIGVAKVKLPSIVFPCVNISGAGMMGEMEVPLYGMVNAMSMTINWLTPHGDAVRLMSPEKHQLDMRVAEVYSPGMICRGTVKKKARVAAYRLEK